MRRLLVALAVALGGVAAGSGTAHAWPYQCSAWTNGNTGHAYCAAGTGAFYVKVWCYGGKIVRGSAHMAGGNVVSVASCGPRGAAVALRAQAVAV